MSSKLKSTTGLLLLCIALFACQSTPKKNPQNAVVYKGQDGKKYLALADAEVFDKSWSHSKTLFVQMAAEPDNMHPCNSNSEMRSILNNFVHKYLLTLDLEQCGVMPDLAIAMPEEDATHTQYVYTLRENAKWDDGSPITCDDILFSYKAYCCPLTQNPHQKPYLNNIKRIEKVADKPNAVRFVMERAYVQNLEMTIDYPIIPEKLFDPTHIMRKESFEGFKDKNFKANPALEKWAQFFNDPKTGHELQWISGAGPYKFVDWKAGEAIILVKKANYWATNSAQIWDQQGPDTIYFKSVKDPNTLMLELKNQQIDASTFLSAKPLLSLQEDSAFNANYNSCFVSNFNYSYIAINCKPDGVMHGPLFTDKSVRRALAYLTPVDDIIKVVYKNKCGRTVSMVSPLKAEYNKDLALIPVDVEKAKALLAEAGWKDSDGDGILDKVIDGKKWSMRADINIMNAVPDWKDIANMVAEVYRKAGIELTIQLMDPGVFVQKNKEHDFDLSMGSWGGVSSADDFTSIWSSDSWKTKGNNFTGFGNAQSDALIDSCKYIVDFNRRVPYIKAFQALVYEEQPYIFLNSSTRRLLLHKRWGNAKFFIQRPGIALNSLQLIQAK